MRFMEPGNVHFWQAVQVILVQVACKPHFKKSLITTAKCEGKGEGMEGREQFGSWIRESAERPTPCYMSTIANTWHQKSL